MTDWKYRVMLFVRAVDATAANKTTFANVFVNNGSGESLANEKKMFDSVARLSTTGNAPVQVFGISTVAKRSMRDGLKGLLDTLTNARYVVSASVPLPNFQENELITTNFSVTPSGQLVDWEKVLQFLKTEFGLIPIVEKPL